MVKQANRWIALGTLGVMTASTLGVGITAAQAGSKGRRNTTIALGAVTAAALLKKKKTVAAVAGVGTGVAYLRYRKAKKAETTAERRRRAWYMERYGRHWQDHYVPGS